MHILLHYSGSYSSCREAVFDILGVENAQVTSNGDFTDEMQSIGVEIWCPSGNVKACHLIGTQGDSFHGLNVYVDESFSYDYLKIDCNSSASCNSIDISCDGGAGIHSVEMIYTSNEYQCANDTASFCCPFRNCSVFNDPQMGFNWTLIVGHSYVTQLIDGAADRVQQTSYCSGLLCVIRCSGLLSCAFSTISIDSPRAVIECEGEFGCLGSTVMLNGSTKNQNVKITCIGM